MGVVPNQLDKSLKSSLQVQKPDSFYLSWAKNTGTITQSDYEKVSKKLSLGDRFWKPKKRLFYSNSLRSTGTTRDTPASIIVMP
jgi:hypothetical protein